MQRTELGLGTKFACLIHSPTKVTRVLRFAILARGVGMEEEAGKIKEGLFCPAWTWASEKQGTIRKFYGKDMCFQKTLLLAERMDWRKQNGITSMFPSCFVGLSGLKSRILFFGLFRLNLYVPIMIRKVFNTKSNSRGCTKSTSLLCLHIRILSVLIIVKMHDASVPIRSQLLSACSMEIILILQDFTAGITHHLSVH